MENDLKSQETNYFHTKEIPKKEFKRPLLIYKISSDKALFATLKIINYLFKLENIQQIAVEDIKLIQSCFENNEILTKINLEEYQTLQGKNKLENLCEFNLELHKDLIDLCIVIGGDGTIVWANSLFIAENRPPFLTFNLGTLGYMSNNFIENYEKVFNDIFNKNNKLYVERRSFLKAKISLPEVKLRKRESISLKYKRCNSMKDSFDSSQNEKDCLKFEEYIFALNDITIERKSNDHMIKTMIYYNEQPLTTIKSNGIILASPTGSTAYSLSAAGTIVHYGVDCFILNSICPHSLSFRPIAFPRGDKLKIVLTDDSLNAIVLKDGISSGIIEPHISIEVEMSDKYVEFLLTQEAYENKSTMWKQKIIDQLGWNNSFKNFEINLNGDKYVEK